MLCFFETSKETGSCFLRHFGHDGAPVGHTEGGAVEGRVCEVDRVNQRVRAQGELNAGGDGLIAGSVDAVGENDERLTARFGLHEFCAGADRVEERGAGPAACLKLFARWGVDVVEDVFKLRTRGTEAEADTGEGVELNQENLVLALAQDGIEKAVGGGALGGDDFFLAHAGVDEQAQAQGKVGLLREVADLLGLAGLGEDEVVLSEVLDEGTGFVADADQKVNDVYAGGEGSVLGEGGDGGQKKGAAGEHVGYDADRGAEVCED